MSLEVIKALGNEKVQEDLLPRIDTWYSAARELLPALPEDIKIYFVDQDDSIIMPGFGVGGYAYNPETMSLGFDLYFDDREEQIRQLESTVYHEGMHIAQGYTGTGEAIPVDHWVVYEGLATVFEREILGNRQPYGIYPKDKKIILGWLDEMSKIKTPWTYDEYSKWAFIDEESGEKWRLYKAGAWLIDQIMKKSGKSVLDLSKLNAKEIRKLYE